MISVTKVALDICIMEQVISYLRGPFLFVFNFHPKNSYERYSIGVEEAGEYKVSVFFLFFSLIISFCVFCSAVLLSVYFPRGPLRVSFTWLSRMCVNLYDVYIHKLNTTLRNISTFSLFPLELYLNPENTNWSPFMENWRRIACCTTKAYVYIWSMNEFIIGIYDLYSYLIT